MPMKFLPSKKFKERQKSITPNSELELMSSRMKIRNDVIEKKKRAQAGFPIDAIEHIIYINVTVYDMCIIYRIYESFEKQIKGV